MLVGRNLSHTKCLDEKSVGWLAKVKHPDVMTSKAISKTDRRIGKMLPSPSGCPALYGRVMHHKEFRLRFGKPMVTVRITRRH